jgi:hypothetical protein
VQSRLATYGGNRIRDGRFSFAPNHRRALAHL